MIRVAFVLEVSDWIGGLNYYRSLLSAIVQIPDPKIEPVLFVSPAVDEETVSNFRGVEIVKSSVLNPHSLAGFLRRVVRKLFRQRDPILEFVLQRNGIDVLSHYSGLLSKGSKIRTVGWVPDFQFVHLPEFFTIEDIEMRKRAVSRLTDHCDQLIVSSECAQKDLMMFVGGQSCNCEVLHFVPEVDMSDEIGDLAMLEEKYGFRGGFFFLPNQFWIHKNHGLVIDALVELREAGVQATVLATGKTGDHRRPGYFEELVARIEEAGLESSFRILGVVDYSDLLSLMYHSIAVINPSLCEGWSTTVEEAKALDKIVILSDIPVHREQSPERGFYFDPLSASGLSDVMRSLMEGDGVRGGSNMHEMFSSSYRDRRLQFGLNYQEVVRRLFSDGSSRVSAKRSRRQR